MMYVPIYLDLVKTISEKFATARKCFFNYFLLVITKLPLINTD